MRRFRAALILAIIALAGCQPAIESAEPFFKDEDQKGAPPLREGVWLAGDVDPKTCVFDEDGDAREWPECAGWEIVRGHERLIYLPPMEDGLQPAWTTGGFVLAGGFPLMMQESNWDASGFNYAVLVNVETDEVGRAIRYDKAPMRCLGETQEGGAEPVCAFDKEALKGLAVARANALLSDENPVDFTAYRWLREAQPGEGPPSS